MRTPLTNAEIEAGLRDLPGWSYEDDRLTRALRFGSFREAMGFIVRLAFEAEALDHHPELVNIYNRVTLHLNTHDAGGKVTEMDFRLARAIENILQG
jgi:4a-hydroxytetrahydrobiopterin dehydratase